MGSIADTMLRIKSGASTARGEVESALAKAASHQDKNIFISLNSEDALSRADEIDRKLRNGENPGRLAGIPYAVKDNFLTAGYITTAATKILDNFKAPLSATAVERLDLEGAICIGKTNLDAFAHGGSTENSAYGPTKNAVDDTRVAGGSSGGSAVAVALDIVPFALGTDTGGSIRQPASFNGVVGLKPTYGTISRYGVVAMASSTDCIGCFSKTVEDAELVTDILSGQDEKDMTTLPDFFSVGKVDKKMKIGLIKEFMDENVDPEVRKRILEYTDRLKSAGHLVQEVELPIVKYALAMYYIIVPAEISSNLARYDGIRYGVRAKSGSLSTLYTESRGQGFEAENKRRIMIGSYVLSSGYFDAYYLKAQKARTILIEAFNTIFREYDMLVGAVTPYPAFGLGENTADPVKMYLADIMTVPASLAGLPAVSVPAGRTQQGLPIGVQIIGPRQSDATMLALARSLEVNNG